MLGIITKIDCDTANIVLARNYLEYAGCSKILCVSALEDKGIQELKTEMNTMVKEYYNNWRNKCTTNYYD